MLDWLKGTEKIIEKYKKIESIKIIIIASRKSWA